MPFSTLLLLASLLDITGALIILFNFAAALHSLLLYFGSMVLFKGIMSVIYSLQNRFYFDFLGWVDVLSGLLMLLIFAGMPAGFVWIFGALLLAKGVWSFLFAL